MEGVHAPLRPSACGWWELPEVCSVNLQGPSGVGPACAPQHILPGLLSLLCLSFRFPTRASWDHIPQTLLDLESLSQGLLLGESNLRQGLF